MPPLTVPLAIPFPAFNPIAVAIGPLAIRWYALAYIGGILLGWVYARGILKSERAWGGPAPISLVAFDDFVLWVTLGIILGGRTGYVLFYNLPFFVEHPLQMFELWNGGMSFHGGFMGCVVAVMLFAYNRGLFFKLQFRAEAFNFTNTPHFDLPDGYVGDGSDFMTITSVTNLAREGIDERQFRFGLKLNF